MSIQAPPRPELGPPVAAVCPHCSSPIGTDQAYCLNCGERLAAARVDYRWALGLVSSPSGGPSVPGRPADLRAALVVLGALATVVLAVAVGIVIGRGQSPAAAAKPDVVTVDAGAAAPSSAAAGSTASVAATPVSDEWPAGSSGWTVELESLPSGSPAAAVTAAEAAATRKGASAVGVLIGADHAGTPSGRYVIYSGDYAGRSAATAARRRLTASFPGALVLHVLPRSSSSAAAAQTVTAPPTEAAKQASGERHLSGKAYEKASSKLPSTVATPGTAPPVDHKTPGAGTSGSCIGC